MNDDFEEFLRGAEERLRNDPFLELLEPLCAVADSNGVNGLQPARRALYLVNAMDAQVRNGGFLQYFMNPGGEQALECVRACSDVGLPAAGALLSSAIDVFPKRLIPSDHIERIDLIMALPDAAQDAWSHLDTAYYDLEMDIDKVLLAYAAKNPEQFS